MNSQEKYAELFATEAREHLAAIGRGLLALEALPDDSDSLDAVFRSAHTIKGMAAAMGYDGVSQLAHVLESVLDEVRAGRRSIDQSMIDVLLESADRLEEIVQAAVAGAEPIDPGPAIERLESLKAKKKRKGRSSAPRPQGARASAAEGASTAGDSLARRGGSRVRVDIRRLDALMNLIGELFIVRSRIHALAGELGSAALLDVADRAGRLLSEMREEVTQSRLVPVWQVFDRFPRVVRDAARSSGKEVELEISGADLELDRSILDAINEPLVHLLRNAVGHGIESPAERLKKGKPRKGRIELSAQRERSRVIIVVRDDGRGVDRDRALDRARKLGLVDPDTEPTDRELFRVLAQPGFSTTRRVTTLAGRGVGLNVVEQCVRSFGGSIHFSSDPGRGTTFKIELPLTVAMVRALIIEVLGQEFALPTLHIRESFEVRESDVERVHGREWVRWRGDLVPLTRLQALFNAEGAGGDAQESRAEDSGLLKLVALEPGGSRLAIAVDRFVGEQEIVMRSFDLPRGSLPLFSGATVRPDGRPALILDVNRMS